MNIQTAIKAEYELRIERLRQERDRARQQEERLRREWDSACIAAQTNLERAERAEGERDKARAELAELRAEVAELRAELGKAVLEPCPFCGAGAVLEASIGSPQVHCSACEAQVWGETRVDAVAGWNTRT